MSGFTLSPEQAEDFIAAFSNMANNASAPALARLRPFYHDKVIFEDPGNTYVGLAAYAETFSHFASATKVGLDIHDHAITANKLFLRWTFFMQSGADYRGDPAYNSGDAMVRFDGYSFMDFDEDGKIIFHQEAWAEVPPAYRAHLR